MRVSHEAIYQALYIQGRGALKRELVACPRTGRALRVPRGRSRQRRDGMVTPEVMISSRPAEAGGHHRDGLEPPFGGTTLPSSSVACRWIASSVSSSAIRRRAATSPAWSLLVIPGTCPGIDEMLPPPGTDHLGADHQVRGNLRNRPAGRHQVKHFAAELRRVTSGHCVLHGSLNG